MHINFWYSDCTGLHYLLYQKQHITSQENSSYSVSLAYGRYIKGYLTVKCEAYIFFLTICQPNTYERKLLYTVSFFFLYHRGFLTSF